MGFNNNINILDLFSKFNQFKQFLNSANQSPEQLLESELKKRNISSQQLKELIDQAQSLGKLFGVK